MIKKIITLFIALSISISASAGILADKFNAFLRMPGVNTYHLPNLVPWNQGVSGAVTGYKVGSPEMFLYPESFETFLNGLPVKYRLNKSSKDPLIYFYQPSPSQSAEVLFMVGDERGSYGVTFFRLTPKEAVKFKKDALTKIK